VNRFEPILVALSTAAWLVALLGTGGFVPLAGGLALSLYSLYGVAAVAGWLAGNVYVRRRQGLPRALVRRLLVVYLVGPPGIVFLLRAMAPVADQLAAPFVSFYAFGVYGVFFFVPVSFGRAAVRSGDER
jgi:predicted ABC-type sugar transport system permease subunit